MSAGTPAPLVFTRAGLLYGMRLAVPTLPALIALALAFGGAASARGMSLSEATSMSAFVAAGAAQMLSLELWTGAWSWGQVLTIMLVTATVNARFILMGASLQPWMRSAPLGQKAVGLFWLFDTSWLITARHEREGGRDMAVLFGAGSLSWAVWVLATLPGYFAGSLISDPRRLAIDLVLPLFFAAMAVPLWRGLKVSALPWAIAAGVALAVQQLVPGYAFIIAGALSGAVTGALSRGRR